MRRLLITLCLFGLSYTSYSSKFVYPITTDEVNTIECEIAERRALKLLLDYELLKARDKLDRPEGL
jgi:hypothetical protein